MMFRLQSIRSTYLNSKALRYVNIIAIFLINYFLISLPVLTFFDNNFIKDLSFIRENINVVRFCISIAFSVTYLIAYYKNELFNLITMKAAFVLLISLMIARFVLMHFIETELWWIIYLEGVIVGGIMLLVFKSQKTEKVRVLAGVISILAVTYASYYNYFETMEPPVYPSILYRETFPNVGLWIGALFILFIPAFFLSRIAKSPK